MLVVSWPDISLLIYKLLIESGCVGAECHRRIVLNRKRRQERVANLINSFTNGIGNSVSLAIVLYVFETWIHLSLLNVVIVSAISLSFRYEHRAAALDFLRLDLIHILLDVLTGTWSVLDNACICSLLRSEFTLCAAKRPLFSTLSCLLDGLHMECFVVFIVPRAWCYIFLCVHN